MEVSADGRTGERTGEQNPKDAAGRAKVLLELVPGVALMRLGTARR